MSAPIALMELLLACEDLAEVERRVAHDAQLRALLAANREGCARLLEGLKREPPRGQDVLAYQRALFDGWVAQNEATSVAFYSLGNPELLAQATREVVDWLAPLLSGSTRVLDFGCGIGRIAEAIAPLVHSIEAVDISANMVEAARRRCPPNVRVTQIQGRDLRLFADASFDLALAVDSFPYVVDAGLQDALFAELHRVVTGKLVVLNYAYDGRAFPELPGFTLETEAQPFTLWNGRAFVLTARRAPG